MYLEASSFKVVSRLPPRRQARRPQWRRPVAPKGVSGMVEAARGVARRGARRQHVSHAPRAAAGGRGRCGDEAGLTAMANPRYRGGGGDRGGGCYPVRAEKLRRCSCYYS